MKPPILVVPQKGKFLGHPNNKGFADTFEWMKDICNNIRGDGLFVEVDRTDENSPIIKLKDEVENSLMTLIEEAGICGVGGNGTFRIDGISLPNEQGNRTIVLKYCNFQFGRKYYTIGNQGRVQVSASDLANTYYLSIPHSNPSGASITTSAGDGNTLEQTVIPLFTLNASGKLINDFRTMPTIPVWGSTQG